MFIHSKNSITFVQAALESSTRRSAFTPACQGIEKRDWLVPHLPVENYDCKIIQPINIFGGR